MIPKPEIQTGNDMGIDLSQHAREVAVLWEAYENHENDRVPVTFTCDEQVWLKIAGQRFREFYTDPGVHLNTQLEGKLWFCSNVIGDMQPGLPERWQISIQLWMEENEFFGCEVQYQDDDYAWGKPLPLDKEHLLLHLSELDPEECVRRSSAFKMYNAVKELAEGMIFAERPIEIVPPGNSTHGIFTKAAEIRGLEQICLDLYDAPDFVEKLLQLVTDKTIDRIKAWHKLTSGLDLQLPTPVEFHCCDDSLQLISAEAYERFVLPCHERLYSAMTTGKRRMHLCGRSTQHYHPLRHRLNVTAIDGPGPFVDHALYLKELGPDFSLVAQTDHSVLANGTEAQIDDMVRGLLSKEAKVPGRFQIVGFLTRHTPLQNVKACYQAGKRHGIIIRN